MRNDINTKARFAFVAFLLVSTVGDRRRQRSWCCCPLISGVDTLRRIR